MQHIDTAMLLWPVASVGAMSTGKRCLTEVELKPPVPDSGPGEEKDAADDMALRQASSTNSAPGSASAAAAAVPLHSSSSFS